MSTDAGTPRPKSPRPSVVTLACVFIAVTAFLTLTEVVSALMDWGTVAMQEAMRPTLKQLSEAGVDLTMTELLRMLRWFALAVIPFAVSAMVFGIYALRGDRSARIATTVLAVAAGLVSLPIGVFGILQAAMMFLAAGALWSPDARRWYRGEPALAAAALATPGPVPVQTPLAPTGHADPLAAEPGSDARPLPLGVRPNSILTAGLLTILGSFVAGGFAGIYLIVHTFAREAYIDAVRTGPFSSMITAKELDLMMQAMFWVSVAVIPLALAGLVGGLALLSRRRIGRPTTLFWAWATAVLGLVTLPVGLLATAGAGTVIFLLFRDDARRWTSGS